MVCFFDITLLVATGVFLSVSHTALCISWKEKERKGLTDWLGFFLSSFLGALKGGTADFMGSVRGGVGYLRWGVKKEGVMLARTPRF